MRRDSCKLTATHCFFSLQSACKARSWADCTSDAPGRSQVSEVVDGFDDAVRLLLSSSIYDIAIMPISRFSQARSKAFSNKETHSPRSRMFTLLPFCPPIGNLSLNLVNLSRKSTLRPRSASIRAFFGRGAVGTSMGAVTGLMVGCRVVGETVFSGEQLGKLDLVLSVCVVFQCGVDVSVTRFGVRSTPACRTSRGELRTLSSFSACTPSVFDSKPGLR